MNDVVVWLVEDNAAFRRAVQRMLAPVVRAVRGFDRCEAALAALEGEATPPAVVLMDIGLPGMDGVRGIRELKQLLPEVSVVVLTVFEDDDKIFRAICAGACGYLLKSQPADDVVHAIAQARTGGAPMNPRVARRMLEMFATLQPTQKDYGLSARELAVLEKMVAGLPVKRIAAELSLNQHTADYAIRCIYRKLHVNCLAAAVSVAINERLLAKRPPG